MEPTQSPINDCGETIFLKCSNPFPTLSTVGTPFISTGVIQNVRVVYVSRNRFAHVGHNKFLKNMIYCAVGADGHLYMRASNHQLQYLEKEMTETLGFHRIWNSGLIKYIYKNDTI